MRVAERVAVASSGVPRARDLCTLGVPDSASEPVRRQLVLIEGEPDQPTVMDHLGVEVFSTDEVTAATGRLKEAAC